MRQEPPLPKGRIGPGSQFCQLWGAFMITFRCSCGKQLKVKEERAGTKVKCPECEEVLRVPETGSIKEKSGPSAPPAKTRPRPADDDEGFAEEERRPRRRARDDDEDEGRPRRRAAARYDDEDDDREHRRRKKEGGNGLLIGIIVGSVLLLAGGGVGLFFLLRSKGPEPAARGPGGPGGEKVNAAAEKIMLENNLRQLALSMHSCNDVHRRLPAPGFSQGLNVKNSKPLLSWRVAILPYIEEDQLYRQFKLDEPWNGPNNIKLLERMPRVFQPLGGQNKKPGHTYLQFVTGPGTLFPTSTTEVAIPRSFRDGTSNTIIIVEAAEPVEWTKPADLNIDVANVAQGTVPKLGGFSPNGFYAALADGTVRFIDRGRTSDKTIRQAFNPADGQVMGQDW